MEIPTEATPVAPQARPDPIALRVALGAIGPTVGGIIAYFAGRIRDDSTDAKRRHVTAKAIIAEVARIHDALDEAPNGVDLELRLVAKTPAIHPWFESTIVAASEISADIPLYFIELQERLAFLKRFEGELRSLFAEADNLEMQAMLAPERTAVIDDHLAGTSERIYEAIGVYAVGREKVIQSLMAAELPARLSLPKRLIGADTPGRGQ